MAEDFGKSGPQNNKIRVESKIGLLSKLISKYSRYIKQTLQTTCVGHTVWKTHTN